MEKSWRADSLFNGMTASAIKLGTVLSCGWFWSRRRGCAALYRGDSLSTVDFGDIVAVAEPDAADMVVPDYFEHEVDRSYVYVVRRANCCGSFEQSLRAAVMVQIDAGGELERARPNCVFGLRAGQVGVGSISLVWFYCPLGQQSQPGCFKVFGDGGSGEVDYENPLGVVQYRGRGYYSFGIDGLDAGRRIFVVRAEGKGEIAGDESVEVSIDIDDAVPGGVEIISAEAE